MRVNNYVLPKTKNIVYIFKGRPEAEQMGKEHK